MDDIAELFKSKYLYLLFSLVLYFLASPFLIAKQFNNTVLTLLISLIVVLCLNVITRSRILLSLTAVLGLSSVVSYWIITSVDGSEPFKIFHITTILFCLIVMTFFVIASIAERKEITKDSLLGAISGYFLLGLTWSVIYILINCVDPNAFINHRTFVSLRDHTQQYIYYSFETLTTLGYGDVLPYSDVARTFSWLEAVTGQIYLAVWISQLVGLRIAQAVNQKKSISSECNGN